MIPPNGWGTVPTTCDWGCTRRPKYYYYPGWHEPGTCPGGLYSIKKVYDELPNDLKNHHRRRGRGKPTCGALCEFEAQNGAALAGIDHQNTKWNCSSSRMKSCPRSGRWPRKSLKKKPAKDAASKKVHEAFKAFKPVVGTWGNHFGKSLLRRHCGQVFVERLTHTVDPVPERTGDSIPENRKKNKAGSPMVPAFSYAIFGQAGLCHNPTDGIVLGSCRFRVGGRRFDGKQPCGQSSEKADYHNCRWFDCGSGNRLLPMGAMGKKPRTMRFIDGRNLFGYSARAGVRDRSPGRRTNQKVEKGQAPGETGR